MTLFYCQPNCAYRGHPASGVSQPWHTSTNTVTPSITVRGCIITEIAAEAKQGVPVAATEETAATAACGHFHEGAVDVIQEGYLSSEGTVNQGGVLNHKAGGSNQQHMQQQQPWQKQQAGPPTNVAGEVPQPCTAIHESNTNSQSGRRRNWKVFSK